jgi:hypothetical protein
MCMSKGLYAAAPATTYWVAWLVGRGVQAGGDDQERSTDLQHAEG